MATQAKTAKKAPAKKKTARLLLPSGATEDEGTKRTPKKKVPARPLLPSGAVPMRRRRRANPVRYDHRVVRAHGSATATVYLMNEAPGDNEAELGIPSVAAQGGNIYRSLLNAGVTWALNFNQGIRFAWPVKLPREYSDHSKKEQNFLLREEFLPIRARNLTCSNSFDRWPYKLVKGRKVDTAPVPSDITSDLNTERIKQEITQRHQVLLVCGESAWLACLGYPLANPRSRELTLLEDKELAQVNARLESSFALAYYMGHTRNWSMQSATVSRILREVAQVAGWVLKP